MVELRLANIGDIVELLGYRPAISMRAIVGIVDGKPLGVVGMYYKGDKLIVFSKIQPELRAYPFLIYKAAKMVMKIIDEAGVVAMAQADVSIPHSDKLLEYLGFTPMYDHVEGKIYTYGTL